VLNVSAGAIGLDVGFFCSLINLLLSMLVFDNEVGTFTLLKGLVIPIDYSPN